jgi:hypothetical protein
MDGGCVRERERSERKGEKSKAWVVCDHDVYDKRLGVESRIIGCEMAKGLKVCKVITRTKMRVGRKKSGACVCASSALYTCRRRSKF